MSNTKPIYAETRACLCALAKILMNPNRILDFSKGAAAAHYAVLSSMFNAECVEELRNSSIREALLKIVVIEGNKIRPADRAIYVPTMKALRKYCIEQDIKISRVLSLLERLYAH